MKRIVLSLAITALLAGPSGTWATGYHHPPIVKPPVVTPPVVTPPIVTPPPSAAPTPTPEPATQPGGYMGGGGDPVGPWVFAGIAVYMSAVVYSHWLFCAQREEKWHKDNKVSRCYNAQRDGLPGQ